MITGWDFSGERWKRSVWGIDGVLLKPLNVSDLLTLLRAQGLS